MYYGYARVSSRDQSEERQIITLSECGIKRKDIYIDKPSGKDFNRTNYKKLIKKLKKGDVLFVKSIDRFGRNYTEILEQWRIITKKLLCDIVVIDMPLLDTRNSRDLTETLLSDIILQLLSYVAEQERTFIKQRQAEGIAAAKERGVKFGRPRKKTPENFREIVRDWRDNHITLAVASSMSGLSKGCFLKNVKEQGL